MLGRWPLLSEKLLRMLSRCTLCFALMACRMASVHLRLPAESAAHNSTPFGTSVVVSRQQCGLLAEGTSWECALISNLPFAAGSLLRVRVCV
jgi:hypothetical protein